MQIKAINKCRICGNDNLIPIIDLGIQALSGRFPSADEPDPPRAPLALVKCDDSKDLGACGLLQLKHSVSQDEMYQHDYGYRSGINQTMTEHLAGIARSAESLAKLKQGDIVLDIGSNDATLLKSYHTQGVKKIGIDPTGRQFAEYYPKNIRLVSDFFTAANYLSIFSQPAKVITSIAMFYDLPAPTEFVADIKSILAPEGVWVFEQSYMPTMLKMNSFDTVCHEHLEYYGLKQIDWMLKKNDLKILDIELNDINGGSFRVYAGHADSSLKPADDKIKSILNAELKLKLDSLAPYDEFQKRVNAIREKLVTLMKTEKERGKSIFIYGASTKGNVLLQFFGIGTDIVTAAADRNPEKWGRRTPGTNIPIISEEKARKAKPDYFLVLPWHFRSEFVQREADFLAKGGKFIFPLPEIEVVGKE